MLLYRAVPALIGLEASLRIVISFLTVTEDKTFSGVMPKVFDFSTLLAKLSA